ncbi:hypothetical protein ACFX1R_007023 [Malus domestica]
MKMSSPKDPSFPKLFIIAFSSDCKRSTLVHLSLLLTAFFLAASSLFYGAAAQDDRHQHRRSSHTVSHGALSDEKALYIKNRQLLYYRDEFGDRGELVTVDPSLVFENDRLRNAYIALQALKRSTTARSGPWPGSTSTTATLPGTCRRSSGCSRISHCSTSTPIGSVETVPHITPAADNSHWSPSLSSDLYRIDAWGGPYFTVNSSGNVAVRPHGRATLPHQEIDLLKIVKKARSLQDAFDLAIRSHDYGSHYQGVYPVKCNQDRFVVEDIVKFGSPFRFRLEVGSKPELLLAMSCLCKGNPDALLICNRFKDLEYISLALYARKLTVIVLEQEEELDLVVDLSRKLGVRPVISVRAKLKTTHSGHFGSTSGEKGTWSAACHGEWNKSSNGK